jgi:hypothetical protein
MGDRSERVLAALAKRISRQGDMPIRVHRLTLRTLMRRLRLDWEDFSDENFREVDAFALDMLRHVAWRSA